MAAPSYPLTLPTTPAFKASEFGLKRTVGFSESIFSGQQKVYEYDGTLWQGVFTLPPMNRASAASWQAWSMKLHGKKGTFLIGDPDGKNPRGSISGAVTVDGDHSVGAYDIDLSTSQNSESGQFKAGDYIQFGSGATSKLHMIVDDASSDSSGDTTVTIEPPLKSALTDGESVTYVNAKGVFRITTNEVNWSADHMSVYGMSFSAIEAL